MQRFFLVICLALGFFSIVFPLRVSADEPYKSSMEWLTLESTETRVGIVEHDMPDIITVPPPSELTIPEISLIQFQYPLSLQAAITTFFSSVHPGIDFAVPEGTVIFAAESGIITKAGLDDTGYGQTIVLHHTKDVYTRYAHLSAMTVSFGQYIFKGTPIGYVGCTGRCTGPHLHFEVRTGDRFVDPLSVLSM